MYDACDIYLQGKEVAVDISRLPEGTVIFEDIGLDMIQGKVLKTLKNGNNRRQSDPLGGRIIYETPKGYVSIVLCVEILYILFMNCSRESSYGR